MMIFLSILSFFSIVIFALSSVAAVVLYVNNNFDKRNINIILTLKYNDARPKQAKQKKSKEKM